METSKKTIIVGVVGVVAGFLLGSLFPMGSGGLSSTQISKLKQMYPLIPDMKVLSGTVKKVSGSNLTIEVPASYNPFDEWPTTRTITVSDTTKIIKSSTKDSKEYQKEVDAFSKASISTSTKNTKAVSYPSYLKEEVIKLSDLKVGDVVNVEADHNVKTAGSFTAIKVTIGTGTVGSYGALPPPPPPPPPSNNSVSGSSSSSVTPKTSSSSSTPPPPPPPPSHNL